MHEPTRSLPASRVRTLLLITFLLFKLSSVAQVWLVFRFDDLKVNNYAFNDSLLDVFEKHNIPLNLALIPFDEEDHPYVSDAYHLQRLITGIRQKHLDIQLHGFNHQPSGSGISEFRAVDLAKQVKKICLAKTYTDSLLGIDIKTFIPPWNAYDSVTLIALDSLGFTCISANKWDNSSSGKIHYLPFTYEGIGMLPEIIKNIRDDDAIIVVLMHQYAFHSYRSEYPLEKITFAQLDSMLTWISSNGIQCCTFPGLDTTVFLGVSRYLANTDYVNSISGYISAGLGKPLLDRHVYYSERYLGRIRLFDMIIWTMVFLVIFVLSYFALVTSGPVSYKKIFLTAFAFVVLILLIYPKRHYSMNWLIANTLSDFVLSSAVVLAIIRFVRRRKAGS